MRIPVTALVIVGAIIASSGCETTLPEFATAEVVVKGDTIFIVDQSGERWDVTHVVRTYGWRPEEFQFGLGRNAIRPITNPAMLSPGDVNYPGSDQTQICIATTIQGDSRAYSIEDLTPHEVVDDVIGGVHVAVGW